LLGTDLTNLSKQPNDGSSNAPNETELVNFQRKILPIDSLDLGIRSFHDQKMYNAAGKKKQKLITLINKVPNLAGLPRTCEIFAARTLVVPNLLVRKQEDFKYISASANDWIEMEECKEQVLMSWLYKKKAGGYSSLGVEQRPRANVSQIWYSQKNVSCC
jgi:tRNA G18 (ribose-2'-O)-methylase SpoU